MTSTETPLADRFTTVTLAGRGVTVTAERTECPHLVIAPIVTQEGRLTEYLQLIHAPTGYAVPRGLLFTMDDLRRLASSVAHLDWDFSDPKGSPSETAKGFIEARKTLEFAEGKEIFTDYPTNWGKGEDSIPGDADSLVRWLLDGWQALYDHLHKDHPNKVPMNLPDGKPNPEWTWRTIRQVDVFGIAYLLASLRRVAPDTANHAAAFLAQQWASGDSIGEWVWQWRHEIENGEPLHLPAVPSPSPQPGELFEGVAGD